MLDIKAWDSEEHRRICGVGNERVLANLALLAGAGLLVEARTVVSPGLFDVERTVRETAAALSRARDSRFGPPTYRLAAFRRRGVRERWAGLAEPDGAYMARLAKLALDAGAPRVLFI
jgi:pyruvate formate lyase activating enzyme